jgi:hypothetical protein
MAVAETEHIMGVTDKRQAVTNTGATPGTFDSSVNYNNVENLRARLNTIDSTYFSSTMLDRMTKNDMVYALRLADDSAGV